MLLRDGIFYFLERKTKHYCRKFTNTLKAYDIDKNVNNVMEFFVLL